VSFFVGTAERLMLGREVPMTFYFLLEKIVGNHPPVLQSDTVFHYTYSITPRGS